MKIYAWGFISQCECIIADSYEESWDKLTDDMRNYLVKMNTDFCKVVEVVDGKFCAYDIWEF